MTSIPPTYQLHFFRLNFRLCDQIPYGFGLSLFGQANRIEQLAIVIAFVKPAPVAVMGSGVMGISVTFMAMMPPMHPMIPPIQPMMPPLALTRTRTV